MRKQDKVTVKTTQTTMNYAYDVSTAFSLQTVYAMILAIIVIRDVEEILQKAPLLLCRRYNRMLITHL